MAKGRDEAAWSKVRVGTWPKVRMRAVEVCCSPDEYSTEGGIAIEHEVVAEPGQAGAH